jgi:DNA-binding transcriptional ArsR family regulator
MSNGLESLHKILKDKTRRKILRLIKQKNSVSYTELSKETNSNTGTLNYHLKVLEDLLSKDDSGQYMLTEKGIVASNLIQKFTESEDLKKNWGQKYWAKRLTVLSVTLFLVVAGYLTGYVNMLWLGILVSTFLVGYVVIYFEYRWKRPSDLNTELEALNKLFKDETRRKILLLVNEKNEVSYTDIMEKTGAESTGMINYHLKVMGELLSKNQSGKYTLTEKGKTASNFLLQFPNPKGSAQAKKIWENRYWMVQLVLPIAMTVGPIIPYLLGYLNESYFIDVFSTGILSLFLVYAFYKMPGPRNKLAEYQLKEMQPRTKKDIFVLGRSPEQVKEEVHQWMNSEKIKMEIEKEGFVRGKIDSPSELILTFEISLSQKEKGVFVHTEGWLNAYDVSEYHLTNIFSFDDKAVLRRKGWEIINVLWAKLETLKEV